MKKQKKVSYIRKPFAKKSFLSLGLSVGALVLGIIGITSSVMAAGQAQLNVAAVCFCSLLISFFPLVTASFPFLKRKRNIYWPRLA